MHFVDLGESFPTHIFSQNLASIQLRTSPAKFAFSPRTVRIIIIIIITTDPRGEPGDGGQEAVGRAHFREFCKFLAGSFSAVSKRNFARKYAFDSIFQALQDLHPFAPLQSQNFRKNRSEKTAIFVKFQQKKCKCRTMCKILSNFKNFSLIIW